MLQNTYKLLCSIFLFSLVDFQSLDIPHILVLKFTNSYLLTYLVIYLKGIVSVI